MLIPPEAALATAEALEAAAKAVPVVQLCAELTKRGREWREAAELMWNEEPADAGITVLGAVVPSMYVFTMQHGALYVIRTLSQGGQWSLHLDLPDRGPQGIYQNYHGPASPVVVGLRFR